MRQAVQPGQAQQLLGPQQAEPPRPLGHEPIGQPARFGQRRQHQGVDPEAKARQQAGQRTAPGAPLPVHAAQQRRRKLRHRSKADQADADQCIGLAGQPEVHIAQQQHQRDAGAADGEQQTGQLQARRRTKAPGAQQQRHHQVIADHGGDGDGLDDHHARGGGQATDKGQQRQRRLAMHQWQREHKVVGAARRTGPIQQQATQRNRQHKQVDQQQVERKSPDRALEVSLVHVLDHHHLELARQEDHRQHRQQHQRKPLLVGKTRRLPQPEQRAQRRHGLGAGKQIGRAVKQAPGDVHPHRQKRQQLDHRFKRNRRHHALVALGAGQLPGAKHHREAGHQQGHVQRAVLPPGGTGAGLTRAGRGGQQGVAGRYRLELQGGVGHDAHQRDQRDQPGQQRAFAVTAGDEVGNRGDAVGLGDADHLAHTSQPSTSASVGPR